MDVLNVASTGVYTKLALIMNFKWNACKKWTLSLILVVILITVIQKLCKEYSNTATYNTSVLLRIKYWTVWYIEQHYSKSTYTGVTNFQKKQSGFFWLTLYNVAFLLVYLTCLNFKLLFLMWQVAVGHVSLRSFHCFAAISKAAV